MNRDRATLRLLAGRVAVLAALALAGCTGGSVVSGLSEPVRVHGATFHTGDLPGTPPTDGGAPGAGPAITSVENASAIVTQRQAAKLLSGRASPAAYSVAFRLVGLGTGYWVVPVGGADPSANDELVWQLTADFGGDLPLGLQTLRLVALDANGAGGPQTDVALCVVPEYADNLNACDPHIAPPAVVVSLTWDTDVDLDLALRTPGGAYVDWSHPTTAARDGGRPVAADLASPHTGALDRNSNAACAIDSIRRESVIWQGDPAPGIYGLYVNMFAACGQASARFRVTEYVRTPTGDGGTSALVEASHTDGVLTAGAANGGTDEGLFVGELSFP